MSWKVEVQVSRRPEWNGNAMRYTTELLARREAQALMNRWLLVDEWRVVESDEPANYGMNEHGMVTPVDRAAAPQGERDVSAN